MTMDREQIMNTSIFDAAGKRNRTTSGLEQLASARSFSVGRHCLAALGLVLGLAAGLQTAEAQVTAYQPVVVVTAPAVSLFTPVTGYPNIGRVGVDKLGNVFYNNAGTLYEIPASTPVVTGTPLALVTGLGTYNSQSVTVDANGNLWVSVGNGHDTGSGSYSGVIVIPATATGVPNTALVVNGTTGTPLASITAECNTSNFTALCDYGNMGGANLTSYYVQASDIAVRVTTAGTTVYIVDYDDNVSSGAYNRVFSFTTTNPNTGTLIADHLPSNNGGGNLAVDAAGNVYYADTKQGNNGGGGTGEVFNFGTATNLSGGTGGSLTGIAAYQVTTAPTITSAAAPNAAAQGLGTDQYGNLYLTSSSQISEVPFEGTAENFTDEFGLVNGLTTNAIFSPALDANGNLYFAGYHTIAEIEVGGHNFGAVAVGSSTPVTGPALNFYFNSATAISGNYFPTGSPISNTYAAYLQSFPYSGTKTCAGGGASNAAGTECSATINFQPVYPGLLKGSYTPRDASSNQEAVAELQGVGMGPQSFFLPGVATTLFSSAQTSSTVTTPVGLNGPEGLAVDTYGDIFVADTGNGKVVADCLATTTAAVDGTGTGGTTNSFCGNTGYLGAVDELQTGFTHPSAVALDGANNLYVTDSSANTVTKIQSANLASSILFATATTVGSPAVALSGPKGIAVDGYANVYIADTGNGRIVKAHQYGAADTDNSVYISSAVTFGGTKLASPSGLALDSAGDLFIADTGNNRIVEYTPLGVASVVSTTGITLNAPTGVAVLPSGSLVVTDAGNNVSLITGGTGAALAVGTTTPTAPQGVALDLAGNIYLSDTAGDHVIELNVSSPTKATFASTTDGATSTADTTNLYNSGNATLSLSAAPSIDAGDTNFGVLNSGTCTSTSTVAPGAKCTVLTDFTPQTATGALTGTVTITDNQLAYTLATGGSDETATYGTTGTQTIALSGTATSATGQPQTITFPQPTTPVTFGAAPVTLTATASSGLAVTYSVTGPATVSGSTLTYTGAGTVMVTASQSGNTSYGAATPVVRTIVVNQASQTITFPQPTTPITYTPGGTVTLTATANSGLAVAYSVTGPATVSGSTLTITGAGNVMVTASQGGNANYTAATPVSQTIIVNPANQTITFTAPTSPVNYGVAPITLVATASSGLAVTFTVTSGPGTIAAGTNTLTVTGAGTIVVAASQTGNANYNAATTVSQTIVVNPASQTITFTAPTTPVIYPGVAPITLSATASSGLAVTFTVTSGPATVSGSTLTITGVGTVVVTASQAGNANYSAATPVSRTIVVNPPPTFTVSVSPGSLTVNPGSYAAALVSVTGANGFASPVQLSCISTVNAICTFTPGTVTPSGATAVTSTLTVYAPAQTASSHRGPSPLLPLAALTLGLGLLGFRKRRRIPTLLLLAISAIALGMTSGCGGSSAGSAPSTSMLTINASSTTSSAVASTTLTLTIP
jgi:hypothetical protein